jgi:uncharacterized protein YndB with AHSA1/START domain
MKQLEAMIEIQAPPEQVWSVVLDFERYADWNPFIPNLQGKPHIGERLQEVVRMPNGQEIRFKPVIREWARWAACRVSKRGRSEFWLAGYGSRRGTCSAKTSGRGFQRNDT